MPTTKINCFLMLHFYCIAIIIKRNMETILFLIGRIIFGGYFLLNGVNHMKNHKAITLYAASKRTPVPGLAVFVSGLLILLGGVGIIFWMYPKISLILISVFLFFVTLQMHRFWESADQERRMTEKINFLKNFALFGAALIMFSV